MLLDFCERALSVLSSAHALSNACFFEFFALSVEFVVALCCFFGILRRFFAVDHLPLLTEEIFSFLHSPNLAFTFYITTKFPCSKYLLGNLALVSGLAESWLAFCAPG